MCIAPENTLLLLNLGTPTAPTTNKVADYLKEFLLDPRVIDINPLLRQLLVRFLIVPKRAKISAAAYQKIWERGGSPLLVHSQAIQSALQLQMGNTWQVKLAMRYQFPSLKETLDEIQQTPIKNLVVFPLFPHYASATVGSLFEFILKEISRWQTIPNLRLISDYSDNPHYIDALTSTIDPQFEHILVSFHGLPERQVRKSYGHCICSNACCTSREKAPLCYRAACLSTFQEIRRKLPSKHVSMCFQSRFGKEPWLGPDIQDEIQRLAKQGVKRIGVLSPSFTTDCIETLYEIGHEGRELFILHGGEQLCCFPSLNSSPQWITTITKLVS